MFYANMEWTFVPSKYKNKFQLENFDKKEAVMRWLWNAHKLPDFIDCYTLIESADMIRVPNGIRWYHNISDNIPTVPATIPPFIETVKPYDYQEEAVNKLLSKPVWLLHATTGSGKTIMGIMIAQRLQQRTLIVVKDKTLLSQTLAELNNLLWLTVNYYGWPAITKKYQKRINTDAIEVSTIQSIDKVDTKKFSVVILDEVHTMLGSDARREFVWSLTTKHIYWLTWTPIINKVDPRIWEMYIWPTTKCEVINMTPDYVQITTNSMLTEQYDALTEFHKIKEEIYNDEERNNLIVDTVKDTLNWGKWIVFTDQIEHAKLLQNKLQDEWIETYLLIWEVKSKDRDRVKQEVKDFVWPVVIVGSVQVIGTGFDLPELSRAYLTTTTRFNGDLLQYVWRIIRKHPTKQAPIFYDFVDQFIRPLHSQSKARVTAYRQQFTDGKVKTIFTKWKKLPWER